jgi:hypothetical protein
MLSVRLGDPGFASLAKIRSNVGLLGPWKQIDRLLVRAKHALYSFGPG